MKLADWVGRTDTAVDTVTPVPCAALAATLDRDPARPEPGTPLPPLWHWLYFLPAPRQSELGPDGHPLRGGFLPPVPLPRRMWAGSEVEFRAPLRIGDRIERTSTIDRVTGKEGRNGPLVFVRVRHEIRNDAGLALIEFHDIVYREPPRAGESAPPARAAPATATWERAWTADPVMLFRYSALTFNGHRIHYDRRYATEVEGYPGLVVHGPLLATLLLDLVREHRPTATVRRFSFRALRPIFDIHPFSVCGAPQAGAGRVELWTRDHAGAMTIEATAEIA